ncbi:aminoglycoside phosphotransferase family protein [Streptomyces nitrosporeus]|uniref:Aminoglycoside phosphotransferase family protein n=1 Tax=Streptomyces nitrosporeus TaxID=28894 RepID=A0A5J6FGW0_9ACTN|nr:aminoglycoside phosphotransferase family protein [Streptomyces nitrosporeus]QEU74734.1 aminoglycoside phosphotransferase family protein [Streptomyces nitrosporeus]GGY85513.1 trifolitoxin immunity protein [Streptomyces nitrosporeus]
MPTDREQPLSGGNVSEGVVRLGDTVRRPAGPWTPAVHALLTHLHEAGFRAAPRPLGIDERGREVLSFVPGEVIWPDRFALVGPDGGLARVARLIRGFHDAVEGFTPPPDARWQLLMPVDGADIIAHHDLAPWNLVAGDDAWAFIDWDNAGPGTRLSDLAYAAHGFLPLSAHPHWQSPRAAERLRLFADAYGLDEQGRRDLVPLLGSRTRAMHDFLRDQAARNTQPWARLWAEGHGDSWRGDAEYTERREEHWLTALLAH